MRTAASVLAGLVLWLASAELAGQGERAPVPDSAPALADPAPTIAVAPGIRYRAGGLHRFLLGHNRRDLWLTPLSVPVLDLHRYAGGLGPVKRGGNQTRTLHFRGADGRTHIFRSVDKVVAPTLPADLRGTVVDAVLQDYISALHPAGALAVAPLHRALGLLSDDPRLFVMPDDPRLGEFRGDYAGLLGQMVMRPEAEPDGAPWGGADAIIDTGELIELLDRDPLQRPAVREYLAARLLDFVVGDPDRGPDQWRWAREPAGSGRAWRPVARDRDWAFIHADGLVARAVRMVYPKLLRFGPQPDLDGLTWSDHWMDRRLLAPLDRRAFVGVMGVVRDSLTDAVIDSAVAALPDALPAEHAAALATALRARRDALPDLAGDFYDRLAAAPDVRATEGPDHVEVQRHADGGVSVLLFARDADVPAAVVEEGPRTGPPGRSVTLAGDGAAAGVASGLAAPAVGPEPAAPPGEPDGWRAYYVRQFRPGDTREVRVFLGAGDDVAVVRGGGRPGKRNVAVRLVGGAGDDHLVDGGARGPTYLYAGEGRDRVEAGPATRVDRRPYDPPDPTSDWLKRETGGAPADHGEDLAWLTPAFEYGEGAGVVVGAGPTWTEYGFRRHPHATELSARLLHATRSGGWGIRASAERRLENSPIALRLDARATTFEAIRFYGWGNDSEVRGGHDRALVLQRQVRVQPALAVGRDAWRVEVGPVVAWTDPEPRPGGATAEDAPYGSEPFGQAGAHVAFAADRVDHAAVPRRGVRFRAGAGGFADVRDARRVFGRVDAEARGYAPLPLDAVLAVRLGGQGALGRPPVQEAARIGGAATLRGYRWQRFAGDAALYGGVELRVPLVRAELLAKGRLGLLGLADAGRVWRDGASPGGWHEGYGAGVWFATLDRAVSLVWGAGEEDRVYVSLGMPF